ncbi:MAG TPA: hypothetical protein VIV60_24535 [Polyangiaceae bacterium]
MRNSVHAAVILCVVACTNDVAVTNRPSASTKGPEESRLEGALISQCRTICEHLSTCPGTGSQSCTCDLASTPDDTQDAMGSPIAAGGTGQGATTPAPYSMGGQLPEVPMSDCVCESKTLDFDDCFKDCVDEVSETFLNGGESCAKAGADAIACFAGMTCAALSTRSENTCGFKSAADLCPKGNSDSPTSDSTDPTGGAQGGSGSVPVGGPVSAVGGSPAVSVTCQDAQASVPVLRLPPAANQQLCDVSSSACSDGHTYRIFCGTNNELHVNCFCVFDGKTQVMFENPALLTSSSPISDCQDTNMWNAHCGWSLMASTYQYE